jgi:hypothetical protein
MKTTKYETLDNKSISLITDNELDKLKFLGIDNIEFLIGLMQTPQTKDLIKNYLGRDEEGIMKLMHDFMALRGDLMESMVNIEVKDYPLGLTFDNDGETTVDAAQLPTSSVLLGTEQELPESVNLINNFPPIRDQGQRGTCTSFTCCALREYLTGNAEANLSEQFLYWACQKRDNPLENGSEGTRISTAMAVLKDIGVCPEETWHYVSDKKKPYHQGPPPDGAEVEATDYRLMNAVRIPISSEEVCSALARGFPVAVGIPVYKSWSNPYTQLTGRINMPFPSEVLRGGHAVLIVAYDKDKEVFVFRNSWGEGWASDGDFGAGYGIMPMKYLTLGFDAWIGEADIERIKDKNGEKKSDDTITNEPMTNVVMGGTRSGSSLLGFVNDPNPTGVKDGAPVHIDTLYENDGWHVIFICGQAGSGKSHSLSVIIENIILDNEKNKAVVIIDAEGEHWSFKEPSNKVKELKEIGLEPQSFPTQIFVPKGSSGSPKAKPDDSFSFAISDFNLDDWCIAFKVRGDRQVPLLRRLLECMEKGWTYIHEDLGIREEIGPTEGYGLGDLIQCLNHEAEINNPKIGYPKEVIRGVNNVLSMANSRPWLETDGTPITKIVRPGQISVMDVSGVSDDRERVTITELIARKLFDARHRADTIPPVYLVVDEAHLFAPRDKTDMSAPSLIKIAKRGRKKGVSLICATQQPSATDDELISQVTLMVGHVLTMANDVRAWRDRTPKIRGRPDLTVENLKTGDAIVSDRKNTEIPPLKIRVRPRMSKAP